MVTDRVGDFIIRLQNASAVGKRDVQVAYSGYLLAIAHKLKELGFIESVEVKEKDSAGIRKNILVTLAYNDQGVPRLQGVRRVSKPGRRLYAPHTSAHRVRGGVGARLISTSAGILSDKEAQTQKIGGENLFEIW
ncbi:30S ribosomal protein S8 [Candidatus Kaiserbacteria bacterium CG10_big_fil_rev_8_21_14_0_10_56_12]|uniref:Small ribosomal subunit protein uS8 n=1 Tax=Candidatus Kaiserbacteria bacterium CG10_big_fil_rev_8_21_14_0_10_56_12 TaxID=1974611 RepID=A0A2H0U9I3_9BACT|nr:MAG: 30S ribosomal protein S8 [Candidatus Kaiserbacteria bacterium CG10_big_fil_rev_8_21_14_0_10_56_12]